MLRHLIFAAALPVLTVGLARAQVTGPIPNSGMDDGRYTNWNAFPIYERSATPEEVGRVNEIDRRYRETVAKIPDKKPSRDPWKNIRAAPTSDRHTQPQ
jgi:hypothetical protein